MNTSSFNLAYEFFLQQIFLGLEQYLWPSFTMLTNAAALQMIQYLHELT